MNENLLTLAKKHQKDRNWHKAIECLEQYMNEHKGSCDPSVYVSYARSLRISGQTEAAKKSLINGITLHPAYERLLVEFHILYDFTGEWYDAKIIAKKLIKLNPQNADYHFRLGRSCSFLLEYKNARKSYRRALELEHGLSFNELIKKIQRGFSKTPLKVRTTYIFIDGKNNLGAFVHEVDDKKYFTKISTYTNEISGAGREELFYKELCSEFPQLDPLVPQYVDSQVIDKISYITMEKINSAPVEQKHLNQIIKTSQTISSISYSDIRKRYPLPNYVYQFKKGRGISVVHFFTRIHEEAYNEKLFDSIYLIMKQHHYPSTVKKLIKRLEAVIMDNQLYTKLEPEKHYSLLHGDFAFQNIMINKTNDTASIIDWTSFTIGPAFIDIARYVTSLLLPYSVVKEQYLSDQQTGGKLESIEHIFFLYALILFYFQKLGRKGIETELTEFLLPALEDLEYEAAKYVQMEGDSVKEKTHNADFDDKDLKIKQLEQRVTILEEERKQMHKRLNDVLASKSWKITLPLRLFTERKKKNT